MAQSESLTKAAGQLKTTKASLSKKIKRLENEFSITLFTRFKQRLQLTAEGEVLLGQCLRLKRELDDTRSICQQFHGEPAGLLHIVAFSYFAKKIIFPNLKGFLSNYPKINLRIDTTECVPDFVNEQIDLAVGFSLPVLNPGEVIQRRMATTRYVMCASPQYIKEYGQPKGLNDLINHRYIEHSSRLSSQLKLKAEFSVCLQPYLIVNTVSSMIDCAENHLGIIQLPFYILEEKLKSGVLIEILKEVQSMNASVYYHYPKFRYMQPKVRSFIDYFLETNKK
ncbi:LysR family transcriptional regulator [Piscirickettsia salmonis]|uniref:LysR family transcriptional regulator n=1 Tax=Piscirickettsia salmonis TaxID=1238 RepID=UPI00137C3467|nr:LysR family transcriptional regulator [Piscirickettsia salmonis]QHS32124.1 LysR family transcriptional regulator [Piscirickettsia salmonis]QIX55541.1 LysR family transcriptional regulator [Piscirickettsia salmonis]